MIARRTILLQLAAALLVGAFTRGRAAAARGDDWLLCDESGAPLVTELGEQIAC